MHVDASYNIPVDVDADCQFTMNVRRFYPDDERLVHLNEVFHEGCLLLLLRNVGNKGPCLVHSICINKDRSKICS